MLRNDILVQQPHVAYTLYDEIALGLRAVTGLGFREILQAQQIVTRALGIWGLLLMAEVVRACAGRRVAGGGDLLAGRVDRRARRY